MKRGGVVLFRDYAEGDMAQARFESEGVSKIAENFHVRGDGTRAYYFPKGNSLLPPSPHSLFSWVIQEFAATLWTECGFVVDKNEVVERDVENRKRSLQMNRLFLQGVYRKP